MYSKCYFMTSLSALSKRIEELLNRYIELKILKEFDGKSYEKWLHCKDQSEIIRQGLRNTVFKYSF